MNRNEKTNPILVDLINDLKKSSWVNKSPIWRDVAKRLEKSRKNWAQVNLSRIDLHATAGETILVPGKLLGAGELDKKLTIAAFSASGAARAKVEGAGGKVLTIRELMDLNPKGTNIRIMG